jgi:hypothetical protein
MNEQDAMARLAAANPVPEPSGPGSAPSSQALFCLRTVLAQPPVESPPRRNRRLVIAAAALILIAGGGTAVLRGIQREPARQPVSRVAAPPAVLTTAAGLAGQDREKGPFVHVAGTVGRVVHVDSAGGYDVIRVDSVRGVRPAGGRPGEGWLTIGEQGSSVRPVTAKDAAAYQRDGSPDPAGLPPGAKAGLTPDLAGDPEFDGEVGDLPDDPAAAAAAMIDQVAAGAGSPAPADGQGWLFRQCVRLLDTFTTSLSGPDRAKIFRTLAALSGIRTLDTATDPMGRPAVGLAYTGQTARYGLIDWQIFLRAGSDQIAFTQAVVRQPGPDNLTLAPGAVQYSTAVTDVVHSDTP